VPSKSKVVALATLAATGVIAALFADPRVTPVTHPLWARMLLRAIEMDDAVKASVRASTVFATLSGRDSRVFAADASFETDGVVVTHVGPTQRLSAVAGTGEVKYAVAIVQGGDYRLRARLLGDPAHPVSAEIVPTSGEAAVRTFSLVPPREVGWIVGGTAHLDPGTYKTSLLLPAGTSLEYVEVVPPCVSPVEPLGGWKPDAITTADDLAVTAIRAMSMEDALAPADMPIEVSASHFSTEDGKDHEVKEGVEGSALKAGENGLKADLAVDLPEAGLYTLEAFVTAGNGQRWHADGCRKAVVCSNTPTGWHPVMTQAFSPGRHIFSVALADGAVVGGIRLVRRKDGADAYVAALRRAGFDPGEGPVTRQTAVSAMQFVRHLHTGRAPFCGDVPDPIPLGGQRLAAPATLAGTVAAPLSNVSSSKTPPLDGAILPPQERASPVQPAS
jgi:hypothetical protein